MAQAKGFWRLSFIACTAEVRSLPLLAAADYKASFVLLPAVAAGPRGANAGPAAEGVGNQKWELTSRRWAFAQVWFRLPAWHLE